MKMKLCSLLFLAVVLFVGTAVQAADYALMLQQTPVQGGVVTPGIGVHSVPANGAISISAAPKPGYQFVYWLGDVSDTTAATTTVSVNSPKIVIAVFERDKFELPFTPAAAAEGAGGGDALTRHTPESSNGDPSIPRNPTDPTYPDDPTDPEDPFPTPEPTTMLLFGLGSLLAARRNKVK